nr:MAG TPA: hypothetical protein [Bacteriophage sp.]
MRRALSLFGLNESLVYNTLLLSVYRQQVFRMALIKIKNHRGGLIYGGKIKK